MLRKLKQLGFAGVLLWAFQSARARCVYALNFRSVVDYSMNRRKFRPSPSEEQWLATLRRDGIVIIESLFDDDEIARINVQLEQLLRDPANIDSNNVNAFNHENKLRLDKPLAKIPNLANLVFNDSICRMASIYKGFIPIHLFNVYKTLPGHSLQGSSHFHRDDLGDMSVFIYLHDVDEHSGASYYVTGSHNYRLKSFFLLSNYEKGIDDPNQAYADSEVEKAYPRITWVRPKGRRGTVVMMDVTGIHKGPYWDTADPLSSPRSVVHMVFRQKNLLRSGYVPERSVSPVLLSSIGSVGQLVSQQYSREARA